MKVGILTFPNSRSYGAALQMFALYQTVKKLGHDVHILNYKNRWMREGRHTAALQNRSKLQCYLRNTASKVRHLRSCRGFARFEATMTMYPRRSVKQGLEQIGAQYDAVICGSDQVWNPDITGCDLSYFLDFCGEKTRRISYAPSFGVKELAADFGEKVRNELAQFDHLSVREEAGQKLIKELTGQEVQLVLDPTLLLTEKEWRSYEKPHPAAVGEYILYYSVRSGKGTMWNYCKDLAEKRGLKILYVGKNRSLEKQESGGNVLFLQDICPREWLYAFRNASCVVTNSFHGTVFSINFKKDFYVEFSSLTNSRLEQIVSMLGLESRIIGENQAGMDEKTDYSQVEERLSSFQRESLDFLVHALESSKS